MADRYARFCCLADFGDAQGFLTDIRHRLHQDPELSFAEQRIAGFVADRLTECSPLLVITGDSQRAKPRAAPEGPQLEPPPQTITTRQHKSGKWREETKTYQPPHRGGYY